MEQIKDSNKPRYDFYLIQWEKKSHGEKGQKKHSKKINQKIRNYYTTHSYSICNAIKSIQQNRRIIFPWKQSSSESLSNVRVWWNRKTLASSKRERERERA